VLVTQGNPAGPTAPAAYDGPYGPNWHVRNQSYAKGFVAEVMVPVPGHPGEFTTELKGSVQVVFDPNNPFWFDTNNGHDYIPRYSESECPFHKPHLHAGGVNGHHATHLEVSHGYTSKEYHGRDLA